jgi:DNA-directed RNA polymerase alpha subunit
MTAKDLCNLAREKGFSYVLLGCGVSPAVELPMSNSLLDLSIDEMDLSTRSNNSLHRCDIHTIRDLVRGIRRDNLLSVRSLGIKSRGEVKLKLSEMAYAELTEEERIAFWSYVIRNSRPVPQHG